MSTLVLTTYAWVPDMPRGYVRDLRVRWALEEAGCPIGCRARRSATARPTISRTSPSARFHG